MANPYMTAAVSSPCRAITPDDVVAAVKHLPSAPRVLPRLKHLLSDGNSSMGDIVALIRLDAGLAARVLQTANSAYFSLGTRCSTVFEAVKRVGFDQIYDLVAYAVASQVLVRPLDVYGIEADELWKMTVTCALASEVLAERTGQERDAAYTIGLLHGVGMVAIDEWSLRGGHRVVFSSEGYPREWIASERAQLGFTQAEVGAALLRHWQFPAAAVEPVRWQYSPRGSAGHPALASLLHAAKWIRTAVCAPAAEVPNLPDAVNLQPLRLTPDDLIPMADEVRNRLEQVSSLLEVAARPAARHRFPVAPSLA